MWLVIAYGVKQSVMLNLIRILGTLFETPFKFAFKVGENMVFEIGTTLGARDKFRDVVLSTRDVTALTVVA